MARELLYIKDEMAYYEREGARVWTRHFCMFTVPAKKITDPHIEYSLELVDGQAILWRTTHIAVSRSLTPMAARWVAQRGHVRSSVGNAPAFGTRTRKTKNACHY